MKGGPSQHMPAVTVADSDLLPGYGIERLDRGGDIVVVTGEWEFDLDVVDAGPFDVGQHVFPTPGTVPGAVDQDEGGSWVVVGMTSCSLGRPRTHPYSVRMSQRIA